RLRRNSLEHAYWPEFVREGTLRTRPEIGKPIPPRILDVAGDHRDAHQLEDTASPRRFHGWSTATLQGSAPTRRPSAGRTGTPMGHLCWQLARQFWQLLSRSMGAETRFVEPSPTDFRGIGRPALDLARFLRTEEAGGSNPLTSTHREPKRCLGSRYLWGFSTPPRLAGTLEVAETLTAATCPSSPPTYAGTARGIRPLHSQPDAGSRPASGRPARR